MRIAPGGVSAVARQSAGNAFTSLAQLDRDRTWPSCPRQGRRRASRSAARRGCSRRARIRASSVHEREAGDQDLEAGASDHRHALAPRAVAFARQFAAALAGRHRFEARASVGLVKLAAQQRGPSQWTPTRQRRSRRPASQVQEPRLARAGLRRVGCGDGHHLQPAISPLSTTLYPLCAHFRRAAPRRRIATSRSGGRRSSPSTRRRARRVLRCPRPHGSTAARSRICRALGSPPPPLQGPALGRLLVEQHRAGRPVKTDATRGR